MKQFEIQMRTFHLKGSDRTYFCTRAKCDYNLNVLGIAYIPVSRNTLPENWTDEKTWRYLPNNRLNEIIVPENSASLSGVYEPAAELENAYRMNILTPDSLDEATEEALKQLKNAVGNVAEFVAERLQFSLVELSEVLSLEQIDAVALAIYNAEARNQGLIVGDQTGIGKGRVAASFIRYGILQGKKPIFFTEKAGLFADIYRDLESIHSGHFKPFFINSDGEMTNESGDTIVCLDKHNKPFFYQYDKDLFKYACKTKTVPEECDFVCCTYSQISSAKEEKIELLRAIIKDNILVMDEAHNAGGKVDLDSKDNLKGGATGFFFQTVLPQCQSVLYLSATYAKRPDNMPIYAINTCISELDGNLSKEKLADMADNQIVNTLSVIPNYFKSLPAQEIISAAMTRYGQFIRRERKTEGLEVRYITLDADGAAADGVENLKDAHYQLYKGITNIIADIRKFQEDYFTPYLAEIADVLAPKGIKKKGAPTVASASIFSSVFHLINNILLSAKAEAVAHRAIKHIEDGKAVVIALADTNETIFKNKDEAGKKKKKVLTDEERIYIENVKATLAANGIEFQDAYADDDDDNDDDENPQLSVQVGQAFNADYNTVFDSIFKNLFYFHLKSGRKTLGKLMIPIHALGSEAQEAYDDMLNRFHTSTSGLCISPIDVITHVIEQAGYKVGECTGRSLRLKFEGKGFDNAIVAPVQKYSKKQSKHVSMCFNNFNNNKIDALIINQSGSTGKSAHATNVGTHLRPDEVKQRVMIVAQAELDVNTEVQKRGRINRTGQFTNLPPLYEYIFSGIPSEKRFMMMLKAKLKSLDANTTANQKQSDESVLKSPDFFNKYGDQLVENMLMGDLHLNHVLNDPLGIETDPVNKRTKQKVSDMAKTVFGRMQVLEPERQEYYYNKIMNDYNALVEQLKADDKYDLEMKDQDFQAKHISENLLSSGVTDGKAHSELTGSSFITKYSIRQQAKFTSLKDLTEICNRNTQIGLADTDGILKRLKDGYEQQRKERIEREKEKQREIIEKLERQINETQQSIADAIEYDAPTDGYRAKLKEYNEKLKAIKSGGNANSPELDEWLKEREENYKFLRNLIDKLRVGNFFTDGENIYCVTQISIDKSVDFDDLNIFSRPSSVIVKMICTDPLNAKSGVSYNLADKGADACAGIVKKASSGKEYDNFLKNDKRREEVGIITGNIVKYLAGDNVIITRYTLDDGSSECGIVIKPELRDGQWVEPEMVKWSTVPVTDKTIRPIMSSLSGATRMNFKSYVGHGEFYIEGREKYYGEGLDFVLMFGAGYSNFVNNNLKKYSTDPDHVNQNMQSGLLKMEIADLRGLLEEMAANEFTATVAFTALELYKDALNLEKYKAQDWQKLSYKRSEIPTGYKAKSYKGNKNLVSSLLLAELDLLNTGKKAKGGASRSNDGGSAPAGGNIEIIDYSDRAWAIIGDTRSIRYTLKAQGGFFNKNLTIDGERTCGWIFSKSKFDRDELYEIIYKAA